MKHLDALLDEIIHMHLETLQGEVFPVAQLIDLPRQDQDRAIVACLRDLIGMKDGAIFEVLREVEGEDLTDFGIAECIIEMTEEIMSAYEAYREPAIDYEALYQPLEHIINDRIDFYNRS